MLNRPTDPALYHFGDRKQRIFLVRPNGNPLAELERKFIDSHQPVLCSQKYHVRCLLHLEQLCSTSILQALFKSFSSSKACTRGQPLECMHACLG